MKDLDNLQIQNKIYTIRDLQVMLDSNLAELYGVETKVFNQSVKRNVERLRGKFKAYEYQSVILPIIVIPYDNTRNTCSILLE